MRTPKKKTWNKKAQIRSALRKVWRWSPMARDARILARVGRNSYLCNRCKGLFTVKEIAVDHIEAVTPVGWKDGEWTTYIERLFCDVKGLQILCRDKCHKEKTKEERAFRKSFGH